MFGCPILRAFAKGECTNSPANPSLLPLVYAFLSRHHAFEKEIDSPDPIEPIKSMENTRSWQPEPAHRVPQADLAEHANLREMLPMRTVVSAIALSALGAISVLGVKK